MFASVPPQGLQKWVPPHRRAQKRGRIEAQIERQTSGCQEPRTLICGWHRKTVQTDGRDVRLVVGVSLYNVISPVLIYLANSEQETPGIATSLFATVSRKYFLYET